MRPIDGVTSITRRVPKAPPKGAAAGATDTLGKTILQFSGQVALYLGHLWRTIKGIKGVRWGMVVESCAATGIEAIPILLLIGFLMGLILAMQAAEQLRQFGASIFVADLVGVAMAREIGPLITGILVAGRSASGFAAEIGAMRINEEVDALETMGFDPHRYLFTPKVLATIMVMPFLTLVTDSIGAFGGYVIGVSNLHISTRAYLQETQHAVKTADVVNGLAKAAIFGLIISLVGSVKGFLVVRGAPEVGRAARAAVVLSIILIIIADAIFTVIFHGG